jgi:hypothetical protein
MSYLQDRLAECQTETERLNVEALMRIEEKQSVPRYAVIVGNVGCVLETDDIRAARLCYETYVDRSLSGHGRCGGEDVTLIDDGEPSREHFATFSVE